MEAGIGSAETLGAQPEIRMTSLIIAVLLAAAFLLWSWFAGLKHGQAGAKTVKTKCALLILYGAAFILGEWYLIVLIADLKWPRAVAFLAMSCWGVLLASGSRWRQLRRSRNSGTPPM